VSRVDTHAYALDNATLAYIANSGRISAWLDDPEGIESFRIWRDGREALQRFVATLGR
jgi:hypothetical protein